MRKITSPESAEAATQSVSKWRRHEANSGVRFYVAKGTAEAAQQARAKYLLQKSLGTGNNSSGEAQAVATRSALTSWSEMKMFRRHRG